MKMNEVFRWLDIHPWSYWFIAIITTLVMILAAWGPVFSTSTNRSVRPWLYPLLILAVLVAWRWPYLLCANELNTDESQFIAGALTLREDLLFWRSVEGMTAGPMVYYLLILPTLFGLPLDYFFARLTGLFAIWLSLWMVYRLVKQHYGESAARLGLLPGTLFVASVFSDDLNHYSSELVTLPLIAAALVLIAGPWGKSVPTRLTCWVGGFVIGLLPWAKLQAAPIGAVLTMGGVIIIIIATTLTRREKVIRSTTLMLGTLVPTLLVLPILYLGGVWNDFYQSYVVQNIFYTEIGQQDTGILVSYLKSDPTSLSLQIHTILPLLLALLVIPLGRRQSRLFALGVPLLLAALICVFLPHRNFLHYTMLLLVPLVTVTGAVIGELQGTDSLRRRWPIKTGLSLLALGSVALLVFRLAAPLPPMIGQLENHWRHPLDAPSSIVNLVAKRGEKMAVWGWYAQTFASNGLIQGTRSAYSEGSIADNPNREYQRRLFLEDFVQNRPEVFFDSVGPNAIFFHDRTDAHESFPALAKIVREAYALVMDLGYARIYARRDLMESRRITPAKLRAALAKARAYDWIEKSILMENLGPISGAHFELDDKGGFLMLPPRQVAWDLQGNEREIFFAYGYHPAAVNQIEGDGTQFHIELLATDGGRRTLDSFLLDPAHNPDQRVQFQKHLVLPPYTPGSKLIIRTDAGPVGYDGWDWAYISNVRFLRSPAYVFSQFPGFNRMPDMAISPLSSIMLISDQPSLFLHAPSLLSFNLDSSERRLKFTYGFIDSDYGHDFQTDGATFKVEIKSPDGSVMTLLSRFLQPSTNVADCGPHQADLLLTNPPPEAQLVITIDPGQNNSCDWTYLTDLQLY